MKAIIFDMDGLMIDTEKFYFAVEKKIGRDLGKEVNDDLLKFLMGRSPKDAANIFIEKLQLNITPNEFLSKREMLMEEKYRNELEPMKGLYEIIDSYKNILKLAIATGSPKKFLDIAVDKLMIRSSFKVLQPSDEIKNGKPDPEIYLKTIEKLNVNPEECIVLEDSSNGAMAGKLAGCTTIAVLNEYTHDQDFSFSDYIVNDLREAKIKIDEIINKDKILA